MKRIIPLTFVAFLGATTACADNSSLDSPTPPPVGIPIFPENPTPGKGGKPKAPSLQSITCVYDNGSLLIGFAVPEGDCILYVTDETTGFTTQYTFNTEDEAEISVGTLSSAYLEFHTSNGHVYSGQMN